MFAPKGPFPKDYLQRLERGEAQVTHADMVAAGVSEPKLEGFRQIAHALRHRHDLQVLDLSGCKLMMGFNDSLAAILRNNTDIRVLNLNSNHISRKDSILLGHAIGGLKQLRELRMDVLTPPQECVEALTKGQKGSPRLQVLTMTQISMHEEETGVLEELVSSLPNLHTFALRTGNLFGATGLVRALAESQSLATLDLYAKTFSQKSWKAVDTLIARGANPNLVHFPRAGAQATVLLRHNAQQVKALHTRLEQPDFPADVPAYTLAEAQSRLPALRRLHGNSDAVRMLVKLGDILPVAGTLTPSALLAPDAQSYCPLDNPAVLADYPAIHAKMAAQGLSFTPAQLETEMRGGVPLFHAIAGCAPLAQALPLLNASGKYLDAKNLLDTEGKPNDLLQLLIRKKAVDAVFTRSNCKEMTKDHIRTLYQALPEQARGQVDNYHQLLAVAKQDPLTRGR